MEATEAGKSTRHRHAHTHTREEVGTTVEIAQDLEASSMWSPPSQLLTEPCDADDLLERISRPMTLPLKELKRTEKVSRIDELGVEVLEGNWTAEASLAQRQHQSQ
ncbi:hypothetical protein F4604DRAFT_1929479 [Suillus subluteus]|nr:hypothetical protein F4604DRAFT_1929479 [Suillus subluteus]